MNPNTKKLAHVLASVRAMELARLSAATKRQLAANIEIEVYRTSLTEIRDRAFDPKRLKVSHLLDADTLWRQQAELWIRDRQAGLARIAADRERQKSRAQLAFARAAAFDGLVAKQQFAAGKISKP